MLKEAPYIINFHTADTVLKNRNRGRIYLSNNTVLYRSSSNTIVLAVHETNLIRYHIGGVCEVRYDPLHVTKLTVDRLNQFTPPIIKFTRVGMEIHYRFRDEPPVKISNPSEGVMLYLDYE